MSVLQGVGWAAWDAVGALASYVERHEWAGAVFVLLSALAVATADGWLS